MDEKKLFLYVPHISWSIMTDKEYLNDGKFEKFIAFMYELCEAIFIHLIPVAEISYMMLEKPKNRPFLPDKPAVYHSWPDQVKERVERGSLDCACKILDYWNEKYRFQKRSLFLSAPTADLQFIKGMDCKNSLEIFGFTSQQATGKTFDELIDACIQQQYAIYFTPHPYEKIIDLHFNPLLLDTKQIAETMRLMAAKHQYELVQD